MSLGKIKQVSEETFLLIEKTTQKFSITISQMISNTKKVSDINFKLEGRIKDNILLLAEKLLSQHPLFSGAGFVLHNESTVNPWQLAWLYRPQHHRIINKFCLNKASQPLVDYQTFSWFTTVSDKGYLHGPYVDYICNSTYTLTYIFPVYFEKRLIGIAATDVMVGQLEQILRETLINNPLPIIMTTASGRVLFSTHPRFRVGTLQTSHSLIAYLQNPYFTLWGEDDESGAVPP